MHMTRIVRAISVRYISTWIQPRLNGGLAASNTKQFTNRSPSFTPHLAETLANTADTLSVPTTNGRNYLYVSSACEVNYVMHPALVDLFCFAWASP